MNFKITASLAIILTVLVACPSRKPEEKPAKKTDPAAPVKRYFVMGNPISLVAGTKMNKKSFLNSKNMEQIDGYYGIGNFFIERTESIPVEDLDEVKKDQAPTEADQTKLKLYTFRLEKSTNQPGTYVYKCADWHDIKFVLAPSTSDPDIYEFTKAGAGKAEDPIKVLHYSQLADGSAFSILIYDDTDPNQRVLMSFMFLKPSSSPVEKSLVDQKYKYIFGPGISVRWSQKNEVPFRLCGPESLRFQKQLKAGIQEWDPLLKGRLKTSLQVSEDCPPFSDLNFHGLYFVDSYLTLESMSLWSPMMTYVTGNLTQQQIIDGDVLVFKKEIEKGLSLDHIDWKDPQLDESSFLVTPASHEFGHFLGLDHQFDGTPSIMSYEKGKKISEYDREAIAALYPKLQSKSKPKP